jgi:hypothetical protein
MTFLQIAVFRLANNFNNPLIAMWTNRKAINAITYDSLKLEAHPAYTQHQTFERGQQRRADRLNEVPETVSSSRSQQINRDLLGDQAIDPADHYRRIGASIAYYKFSRDGADQAPARKGEARGRLQRHLELKSYEQ